MKNGYKNRGAWGHRFLIRLFTVLFAVLVYWTLGFLVEDVESLPGPRYAEVEARYVEQRLIDRIKALDGEIEEADRSIANKREEMQVLGDGSRDLRNTISQLLELQRSAIERSVPLSDAEKTNLSESLSRFLEGQKQYQARNAELLDLMARKRVLEAERLDLSNTVEGLRRPAKEEYNRLRERHNLRLAGLQLALLLPLLAAGTFLLLKKRNTIYFPLFLGFGAATLTKVAMVLHHHFPSRYFKYLLILSLLAVVVKALVTVIRIVAFPKVQWLMKQYREGYERFLCPVCEYPIRTGPRRFLYWTHRTVKKVFPQGERCEDEIYTCPSCGTALFGKCPSCGGIRHCLLPYCLHCGAENSASGGDGTPQEASEG